MAKRYTVSDGKLMLVLEPAEEGGYVVTSPLDPALITQAETLEEAFEMAYDAQECLRKGRLQLARELAGKSTRRRDRKGGVASSASPASKTASVRANSARSKALGRSRSARES